MEATNADSTDYLYNALGQMIEKSGTLGTTIFMQDEAGHLIGEYDGSGNLIEETVWLGDIPVATLQTKGLGGVNVFYVHTDHLNAPRKVAQPTTGTLAWRWDTDPFGTAAPNQNPAGLGTFTYNLRFPGQYYQAETGLNQNVNRDYDSLVGKYVESDPIGLKGGSFSTYSYTRSNPIWFVDPSGLQLFPPNPNISTVVCNNGHLVTQIEPLLPTDEKCLSDCIQLHELKHIDQFFAAGMGFACRNAVNGQVVGTPIENQADWEKEAYAVEIQCLERKLANLQNCDVCKARVQARIQQLKQDVKQFD